MREKHPAAGVEASDAAAARSLLPTASGPGHCCPPRPFSLQPAPAGPAAASVPRRRTRVQRRRRTRAGLGACRPPYVAPAPARPPPPSTPPFAAAPTTRTTSGPGPGGGWATRRWLGRARRTGEGCAGGGRQRQWRCLVGWDGRAGPGRRGRKEGPWGGCRRSRSRSRRACR